METVKALTFWAALAAAPGLLLLPALWARGVSPVPDQGTRGEMGNSSF